MPNLYALVIVKVREHIFGDCTNSFASVTKKPHAVLDDRYIQRYTFEREFSFKVSTFSWAGKYFFLSIIKGERPYANFYVQMLGEEEECRKILVTLSVRDQVVSIEASIQNCCLSNTNCILMVWFLQLKTTWIDFFTICCFLIHVLFLTRTLTLPIPTVVILSLWT